MIVTEKRSGDEEVPDFYESWQDNEMNKPTPTVWQKPCRRVDEAMNREPTVEEDYEQSLLRLVDVTVKLMRADPGTIEELCAEGRNMVQPLLVAVEDLDDAAWTRISKRMHEHNIVLKFRGTGVAPTDRVMRLIFLVTKLSMPRGRPVQLLCDSALAQLDQIEKAAKPSSAA